MPEFTPEYVALMRELALERKFQRGDWVVESGAAYATNEFTAGVSSGPNHVWLPLEADWLRMLEEAERPSIRVKGYRDGFTATALGAGIERHAPTRLEALARLWMAIAAGRPPRTQEIRPTH